MVTLLNPNPTQASLSRGKRGGGVAGIRGVRCRDEYHNLSDDSALDSDLAHLDSPLPLPGFCRRLNRPSHRYDAGLWKCGPGVKKKKGDLEGVLANEGNRTLPSSSAASG